MSQREPKQENMSTQRLHNQRKSMTRQLATSSVAATSHRAAGLDMYGVERPTNAGNEGLWALDASSKRSLEPACLALVAIAAPAFTIFPADLNSIRVAT